MNVNINFKSNTKICVLVGYYDEYDEYQELIKENMAIKELPNPIRKNIDFNQDITIHVAPKEEIRVFAKSLNDIERYRSASGDCNNIKEMFDALSKHNGPYFNGDYICTTVDIEEFIMQTSEIPLEY